MKYYGYIYKGQFANYENVETSDFDSPYEALDYANKKWQKDPNLQVQRLLVVKRDYCQNDEYAFFQFTNYQSCNKFIENNENIVWSNNENQHWHGNEKMMK